MFKKDDQVVLKKDWLNIPAINAWATGQLSDLPADTVFTVTRDQARDYPWVELRWKGLSGTTRSNSYASEHFSLLNAEPTQTVEELIDENDSLNEQIGRLEAELEALQAKIARKYEFVRLNTEAIKAQIPAEVIKYIPYL